MPLATTHLTMGSDSCRPSRLRFCNLEHRDRMPWSADTSMTEFDRSMCWTRKGLNTEEKERLYTVAHTYVQIKYNPSFSTNEQPITNKTLNSHFKY